MNCKWCGSTQNLITTIDLADFLKPTAEVVCSECKADVEKAIPLEQLEQELWKE